MNWEMIKVLLQIISTSASILVFVVIKFNDLKHLSIALNSIDKKLEESLKRQRRMELKQVALEAKCGERHPKNN